VTVGLARLGRAVGLSAGSALSDRGRVESRGAEAGSGRRPGVETWRLCARGRPQDARRGGPASAGTLGAEGPVSASRVGRCPIGFLAACARESKNGRERIRGGRGKQQGGGGWEFPWRRARLGIR
jgi:hypothetical protein